MSVDFWYDQRDLRVHPEGAGVVDDHAASLSGDGCKLLTHRTSWREKTDIYTGEGVLIQHLDGIGFPFELHLCARASFGGKKFQMVHRKVSLL